MFSKVVVIVALFAYLQQANALSCNYCIGSESSDCAKSGDFSAVNNCVANSRSYLGKTFSPNDEIEKHCVSFIMTETPETGSGVLRGCGYMYAGEDICEYIEANGLGSKCTSCQEDFCNTEPVY